MTGNVVMLRGATLRFGQHVIWEDLDLDIAPGDCLAILGPNGAGPASLPQRLRAHDDRLPGDRCWRPRSA